MPSSKTLTPPTNGVSRREPSPTPVTMGSPLALESGDDLPEALIGYTYQAPDSALPLDPYVDDPEWGLSSQEQDAVLPAFWERDVSDGERNWAARTLLRSPALLQPYLG